VVADKDIQRKKRRTNASGESINQSGVHLLSRGLNRIRKSDFGFESEEGCTLKWGGGSLLVSVEIEGSRR
jgi:hypothetical protein